jgi:hypothetical protein
VDVDEGCGQSYVKYQVSPVNSIIPPFHSTASDMSDTWGTSAMVLTTLRSAGSVTPGLGLAGEIALRILTLVQVCHLLPIIGFGAFRWF